MNALVDCCRALSGTPSLTLSTLAETLRDDALVRTAPLASRVDERVHPYGRQVLHADARVEMMLATWNARAHCAPHDHGGSVGAVRILAGEGVHRVWRVAGDGLDLVDEHRVHTGDVLACSADLVHSLGDAGGAVPMATLHLYTQAIPWMVVYDLELHRTLVVDGGCGAWVPHDRPDLVKVALDGFHAVPVAMGMLSR